MRQIPNAKCSGLSNELAQLSGNSFALCGKRIIFVSMKRFLVVISILSTLASCYQDRDEMRERLKYVSRCNRADTVFT